MSLTEEGKRYLESCRQILAEVDNAEAALTDQAAEPSGQLTITAPVLFGQMYVAPALTRLVRRYPELRVQVILLDRVINLLEEGVDAGIRIGPLEDSSLVALPLGSVRRMVVSSPSHLRSNGIPRHPRDLRRTACVCFTGSTAPWWTFYERGKPFNVPVRGKLEFNQVAPAVEACMAGMGFGNFISYQVAPYIRQKKLKVVLEDFEPPPRPVSIVHPYGRLVPVRTRVFIEWMKTELGSLKF